MDSRDVAWGVPRLAGLFEIDRAVGLKVLGTGPAPSVA